MYENHLSGQDLAAHIKKIEGIMNGSWKFTEEGQLKVRLENYIRTNEIQAFRFRIWNNFSSGWPKDQSEALMLALSNLSNLIKAKPLCFSKVMEEAHDYGMTGYAIESVLEKLPVNELIKGASDDDIVGECPLAWAINAYTNAPLNSQWLQVAISVVVQILKVCIEKGENDQYQSLKGIMSRLEIINKNCMPSGNKMPPKLIEQAIDHIIKKNRLTSQQIGILFEKYQELTSSEPLRIKPPQADFLERASEYSPPQLEVLEFCLDLHGQTINLIKVAFESACNQGKYEAAVMIYKKNSVVAESSFLKTVLDTSDSQLIKRLIEEILIKGKLKNDYLYDNRFLLKKVARRAPFDVLEWLLAQSGNAISAEDISQAMPIMCTSCLQQPAKLVLLVEEAVIHGCKIQDIYDELVKREAFTRDYLAMVLWVAVKKSKLKAADVFVTTWEASVNRKFSIDDNKVSIDTINGSTVLQVAVETGHIDFAKKIILRANKILANDKREECDIITIVEPLMGSNPAGCAQSSELDAMRRLGQCSKLIKDRRSIRSIRMLRALMTKLVGTQTFDDPQIKSKLLREAIQSSNVEAVQLLVERGADLNLKGSTGKNAWDCCGENIQNKIALLAVDICEQANTSDERKLEWQKVRQSFLNLIIMGTTKSTEATEPTSTWSSGWFKSAPEPVPQLDLDEIFNLLKDHIGEAQLKNRTDKLIRKFQGIERWPAGKGKVQRHLNEVKRQARQEELDAQRVQDPACLSMGYY